MERERGVLQYEESLQGTRPCPRDLPGQLARRGARACKYAGVVHISHKAPPGIRRDPWEGKLTRPRLPCCTRSSICILRILV